MDAPVPPVSPSPSRLDALLDDGRTHLLLFDGTCGLCDRSVQFVLRHDRAGIFRYAPLGGALAREVMARHPALRDVDSVVLVSRDGAWIKSSAAIRIARRLGLPWRIGVLGALVPQVLRDWAYDQVARRRYRIWGRVEACTLPDAAERARFLLEP